MPPNHSYEEVDIDNPRPEQVERLYDEVVVRSHQRLDVEYRNFEGENMDLHTYETVLSERTNENTKESSVFSHAEKTDSETNLNHCDDIRPKRIADVNFSTSSMGSQYNAHNVSVVRNSVQKGIVNAVIEESSMEDQYYNKSQVHKLSLVSNSSEDSDHFLNSQAGNQGQREGSPHIYQKLDHHNAPATQAPISQETTLKKPMESTGDHEYHVLEEANAQHNRSTSDLLMASDTATPAREGTSREQILSEFKQSPVVFDDPVYSSFPNDKNSTEEESEETNDNKSSPSTESELHVSDLHDPVSNANDHLLSECEQNPPMSFDDPLYSVLPPDKRSIATASQVMIDESDEQCHSPDTDDTVYPDEYCFDNVQEICFQGQM